MPTSTPSWSLPTNQRARPTLNAFPPLRRQPEPDETAERTARHLRLCQELIDIGMTLARAAAARAADDIAAPPPATPIPGSAAAALEHAEHLARHRAPDYGRLFTHLSRAIRQTMLLETHIAEGGTRTPYRLAPHQAANDTPTHACDRDTPGLQTPRRETLERLDCMLPIAPNGEIAVDQLLQTTSQAFAAATPKTAAPFEPDPTAPAATDSRPCAAPPTKPPRQSGRRW